MPINKPSINTIKEKQSNSKIKKSIQVTAISIQMILWAINTNANIQQNSSLYELSVPINLYDTNIVDDITIIKHSAIWITSEIFDNLRKIGQLNQATIKTVNESEEVVVSLFSELIDQWRVGIKIPLNDHNINILKNIKYSLKTLFIARDWISNYIDIFDGLDHKDKSLEIRFKRDVFKYKIINLKIINN